MSSVNHSSELAVARPQMVFKKLRHLTYAKHC